MPCLNPISCWRSAELTKNGKTKFHFNSRTLPTFESVGTFSLPCGKCIGCLKDRQQRWINRMKLEHFACNEIGSFVTLTYRNAPSHTSKKDVQNFLKRFRQVTRDYGVPLPSFRYFFVGERGSKHGRPHYHGLLFNVDLLSDLWQPFVATYKDGFPIYSSLVLEKIWQYGFVTVDRITNANIKYVSKYIFKQQSKEDNFSLKSPKIGASVFYDFKKEGRKTIARLRSDEPYINGSIKLPQDGKYVDVPPPPAFDRYLDQCNPSLLEVVKAIRREYAITHPLNGLARADYLRKTTTHNTKERPLDYE